MVAMSLFLLVPGLLNARVYAAVRERFGRKYALTRAMLLRYFNRPVFSVEASKSVSAFYFAALSFVAL